MQTCLHGGLGGWGADRRRDHGGVGAAIIDRCIKGIAKLSSTQPTDSPQTPSDTARAATVQNGGILRLSAPTAPGVASGGPPLVSSRRAASAITRQRAALAEAAPMGA